MKPIIFAVLVCLACACSESGSRKGHAGAQGSQSSVINESAGADVSDPSFENTTVYGTDYEPPRNFESSVLNEPDKGATNDALGRGYRVNGSGYGFKR